MGACQNWYYLWYRYAAWLSMSYNMCQQHHHQLDEGGWDGGIIRPLVLDGVGVLDSRIILPSFLIVVCVQNFRAQYLRFV